MASILLVDDDAHVLLTLQRSLESAGHQVTAIQEGVVALSLLKSDKYDVLITDGYMADISGYELAMSAREYQPAIKKILISGFYEAEDLSRAIFSRHLKKPVELEKLLACLDELLAEKRAAG